MRNVHEAVKDMMGGTVGKFDGYHRHEPLVSMSCVYDDDAGETEVTFAVPVGWLLSEMNSAGNGRSLRAILHGNDGFGRTLSFLGTLCLSCE